MSVPYTPGCGAEPKVLRRDHWVTLSKEIVMKTGDIDIERWSEGKL